VLSAIFIPVALSWALTGPLLLALGEPREVADDASYYALVLMACLPARIGISQISQFFTSQKIMHPGMTTGFVAMLMNLCLGLVFVLGIPVPGWSGFGFPACPLVTSVVEYCQLALLLGVYWVGMKLYRDCWPEAGWSWSHVTRARVHEFCRIYFPAALSLASDFWRVAAIGAVAAQLGAEEVSVFNCSYRIMWIALTFIGSMGGAMAIHLGVALGAGDTHQVCLSPSSKHIACTPSLNRIMGIHSLCGPSIQSCTHLMCIFKTSVQNSNTPIYAADSGHRFILK
jgi:Na+-driven multidrug efflux pump